MTIREERLHDLEILATHLGDAFPSAPSRGSVVVLGEGFGNLVVETTGDIVFRIAKHATAQSGHRRERLVLPIIQQSVSELEIPKVRYALDTSDAFPFGVMGYEKLP